MSFAGLRLRAAPCLALLLAVAPLPMLAQQPAAAAVPVRTLSLADAIRIASAESEAVRIAAAGTRRARGQQLQARSTRLPQISGSASYARTLDSQFEVFQQDAAEPGPDVPPVPPDDNTTYFQPCTRYLAPGGASDAERVAGLEQFARCSNGGGIDFSRAGFGAANQYNLGLTGSLTLFTGGRNVAQVRAASAGRESAEIELTSQRAQIALDVTEAYFDAALADRLVAIAESSLVQTQTAVQQTRLARQVGNQSEFDLLRAEVTRDNQVPQVLQSRTQRDLAYLRLKQLLNVPYSDSLDLSDRIIDAEPAPAARDVTLPAAPIALAAPDTSVGVRAPVRQLEQSVRAQEAQLDMAKSEWWPTISLSSSYGRVAFPSGGIPEWGNFLTNWTVTLGATIPIFTGGRTRGQQMVAEANLAETRARLDQTREFAALNARQVQYELAQAEAQLRATGGTAQQAQRAYRIAEVRYSEGISTGLELSESRVLLQQAMANRARAARDLQVARVRLALLKDLPIDASGNLNVPALPVQGSGALQVAPQGGSATPNTQQPRATTAGFPGTGL